jgi:hypothetical protein
MKYRRALLAALSVVAIASVAAAIAWQRAAEPLVAQAAASPSADSVPASRSMFPKVLNH